ncbi:hypothetical protein LCGC14_0322860 [marine sediment metagenome]|uniref:Uncharacterized protein n=1 Tax=marine sediment metagenome TaxID=412755 RepID=A0A0F9U181_9ZZZZ
MSNAQQCDNRKSWEYRGNLITPIVIRDGHRRFLQWQFRLVCRPSISSRTKAGVRAYIDEANKPE